MHRKVGTAVWKQLQNHLEDIKIELQSILAEENNDSSGLGAWDSTLSARSMARHKVWGVFEYCEDAMISEQLGKALTNLMHDIPGVLQAVKTIKDEFPEYAEEELKLDTTEEKDTDEETCVVCLDNSPSIAMVPCGHRCCCVDCSPQIGNLCPMCRQNVTQKIKVFL